MKKSDVCMLFQLIIYQSIAQYQKEMNSAKAKAKSCGSLMSLINLISNTDLVDQMELLI